MWIRAGKFKGKNVIKVEVQDEEHLKLKGSKIDGPDEAESSEESQVSATQSQE